LRHVVLSPLAQQDLDDIWEYSFVTWGLEKAESYTFKVRAAIERLAQIHERGKMCDDIRTGYRHFACGSHFIFYIGSDKTIDVKRILHQSMDFDRHL
jgi:toxin ParE1/3/4